MLANLQGQLERLGPDVFRRRILEWEAADADAPVSSSAIAIGYARLGETDRAIEWLEKSFASHTRDLIYLKVEPSYDSLRGDPRFQKMLSRLRLPV